jgi:DNA-binding transcriptional LysR family regulator
MNTNDLGLFEAVARFGSFTKAAEAMFTVQSNVTARIKNLEEEFGVPLFTRTSRKVQLTTAGETLMKYSKQIGLLIDEARSAIGDADMIKGKIKIGCLETIMALKGPDIIKRLSLSYPYIDLEFKSAMRTTLINDVMQFRLDAAFVPAPLDIPELEQIVVKEEQLVIVAPADCRKIEDMTGRRPPQIIVFDQGCVFRARLESWLVAKGIVQYQKIVLNSIEGIINFVESGIGFSFLPAEIISTFYSQRKIKTFPITKELGQMTTLLVYRKDMPVSAALSAFVDLYKLPENAGSPSLI